MDEQHGNKAEKALSGPQCHSSFFQNGLNRIITVMGSATTLSESIVLSPAVEELMLNDCGSRKFSISNSPTDSNDFWFFRLPFDYALRFEHLFHKHFHAKNPFS
jgi:hypothetical protein